MRLFFTFFSMRQAASALDLVVLLTFRALICSGAGCGCVLAIQRAFRPRQANRGVGFPVVLVVGQGGF